MSKEIGAGAVVFRTEAGGKRVYLILKHSEKYFNFPKGHVNPGETEEQAAIRELNEETGIDDSKLISEFEAKEEYFCRIEGKTVFKEVIYFLAETKTKEVKLSFEHMGFEWLPFDKAIARLTFKKSKDTLKKVEEFLAKEAA